MTKEKKLFSKFKKINQFRHMIKDYNETYNRTYDPVTKQVTIDINKPKETLRFYGTTKNHGTNSMITLTKDGVIGAGKRSSAISLDEPTEHFGFPSFVEGNKEILTELINTIKTINGVGEDKDVVLYGEWSGKGVQKNVAVSEVPKHFYVFDFKIVEKTHTEDETINRYINAIEWYSELPVSLVTELNKKSIVFAPQVKTYVIDVDMASPMKATAELEKLTLEVEAECPIGKFFGVEGTGEGIVWIHKKKDNTYMTFKAKGSKHSVSRTKTIVAVDPEKIEKIEAFVEYACTENRMEQAIQEVYGAVENATEKDARIGKYMNWLISDIAKEEFDVLDEAKEYFSLKDVSGQIKSKAQKYLMNVMDKNVMG